MTCRVAPHRLIALAALLLPLLLAAAGPAPALAAATLATLPGQQIALRASGRESAAFVPPPDTLGRPRLASATFDVSYGGFSPEAQAAFQRAVDIWASLLTSPVPIRVQAQWAPLASGVLGSAGAQYTVRDFPHAPQAGVWYPAALANKLAGSDLITNQDDIQASFNSDYASAFYFGDGATPAGQLNFTSVVLHELGHGLGFSGTLRVSPASGEGSWGLNSGYPHIYDRFAQNGAGQALLDTGLYPNPSTQLAAALQGGDVWFAGPQAVAAAGGARPKLYAPNPWEQGSSYSHFDEATYGPGNPNSLMTPSLDSGETIYAPGPVALGLLADLGWSVDSGGGGTALTLTTSGGGSVGRSPAGTGSGPYAYIPGTMVTLSPQPAAGQAFVGWVVDGAYRGWAAPLSLTMNANHAVQAIFAPTARFPDVGAGRADHAAIVALATRGTIRGYADGNFGPDDRVQRAQMAALIARAMRSTGPQGHTLAPPACLVAGSWDCEDWGTAFTDQSGDPNLWRNAGTLQHYGVAQGYTAADCAAKGRAYPCYGPSDPVTYAETITFITRAMIAEGYWQAQSGATQPYAGVPAVFAGSVATFHYYTQGLGGISAPPADWNGQATRGWFAMALWVALDSYWSVDRVP